MSVVCFVDAPEVLGGCERLLTLDFRFGFGWHVAPIRVARPPREQDRRSGNVMPSGADRRGDVIVERQAFLRLVLDRPARKRVGQFFQFVHS